MRKHITAIISNLAIIATRFLMEPVFPLGDIRWLYVIIVCSLITLLLYSPEIWAFITRRKTQNQDKKHSTLAEELSLLLTKTEADMEKEKLPNSTWMLLNLQESQLKLDNLRIRSPFINPLSEECLKRWFHFLTVLIPLLKADRIEEAREIHKHWENWNWFSTGQGKKKFLPRLETESKFKLRKWWFRVRHPWDAKRRAEAEFDWVWNMEDEEDEWKG